MPGDTQLPEELAGLLQEIQANPKAKLFQANPKNLFRRLESPQTVSVAKAGLTTAERHLLSVHRAELAWILRQQFIETLLACPEDSHGMRYTYRRFDAVDLSSRIDRIPEGVIETSARLTRTSSDPRGAEGLMSVWLAGRPLADSLDLEYAPNARVYLASWLLALDQYGRALRCALMLLREPTSPVCRQTALQACGAALISMGRVSEAREHYRAAVNVCVDDDAGEVHSKSAMASALLCSVALGDTNGAIRESEALEGSSGDYVVMLRAKLRKFAIVGPSEEVKRGVWAAVSGGIAEQLGAVGGEIRDALN